MGLFDDKTEDKSTEEKPVEKKTETKAEKKSEPATVSDQELENKWRAYLRGMGYGYRKRPADWGK